MKKQLSGPRKRNTALARIVMMLAATCVVVLVIILAVSGNGKSKMAQEGVERTVITPQPSQAQAASTPTLMLPTPQTSVAPVAQSDFRLAFNQQVVVTTLFECEHEIVEEMIMPREWVGMTREEFELTQPEMHIVDFEANKPVQLEKVLNYYCPQHYVLMIDGDGLGMFQTNAETLQPTLIQRFAFDLTTLDAGMYAYLLQGLPFDTVVEMESFLEDLDT